MYTLALLRVIINAERLAPSPELNLNEGYSPRFCRISHFHEKFGNSWLNERISDWVKRYAIQCDYLQHQCNGVNDSVNFRVT